MHEAFWNEWKLTKELRSTDDRLRLLLDQSAAVIMCHGHWSWPVFLFFEFVLPLCGFRHIRHFIRDVQANQFPNSLFLGSKAPGLPEDGGPMYLFCTVRFGGPMVCAV